MRHKWPLIPLGEVLAERRETPSEEDLLSGRVRIIEKITFDTGRIQLRSNGSTRTGMILVRPGDLVVSGINAAKGAIAIYDPEATEPLAATIHYGAYIPKLDRVDVRFLWWMLRSRFFQELLNQYLPGGIKTELKAKRLLSVPVPLPPLSEQRRIVARIEELAAQINEARTLRQQAAEDIDVLLDAAREAIFGNPPMARWRVRLSDADLSINAESCNPAREAPDLPFHYVDITSVVKGPSTVRCGRLIMGRDAPSRARRRIRKNDIVLSTVRPYLRAFAKVGKELDGQVCSTGFAVISCRASLDPDFLLEQFCSPSFVQACMDRTTGTHYPAVNDTNLRSLEIACPPLDHQRRIVNELQALEAEVERLGVQQAATLAELNALLPAILDRAFKGEL
jgi:type I restriction enzyme S subunit